MALAVFRSCVMSRITVGVTRKLKATCQKKPDCNKIGDRDVYCPGQYEGPLIPIPWGSPVPPGEGWEWDSIDEIFFAALYENEPFPDDVDDEERKALVLDLMYAFKHADHTSDFDIHLRRYPICEDPPHGFSPEDAPLYGFSPEDAPSHGFSPEDVPPHDVPPHEFFCARKYQIQISYPNLEN